MSHSSLSQIISCLSDYDPNALPVDHAQQIIRDFVTPVQAVEKVALRSALDRVLAHDIVSPINVPQQDNSAMDGYALRGSDLDAAQPVSLSIVGSAFAGGGAFDGTVAARQCVRIMTGATMPAGC